MFSVGISKNQETSLNLSPRGQRLLPKKKLKIFKNPDLANIPKEPTIHPGAPTQKHSTSSPLHSMGLLEPANLLDVVHEVTPIHILHHKVQAVLQTEKRAKISIPCYLRTQTESREWPGSMIKTTWTLTCCLQAWPSVQVQVMYTSKYGRNANNFFKLKFIWLEIIVIPFVL
jgi:hypothetical protein